MMLGSCFAEDVGNLLKRSMLALCINPFGTLYNPRSIAQSLRRLMADLPFSADELVAYGNLWHSMSHHSRFSSVDKDRALQKINAAYAEGVACLRSARHLIVTFGTAYTFSTADGETVANCHKMPASMFNRRMLSTNEIADRMDSVNRRHPQIQSPHRHHVHRKSSAPPCRRRPWQPIEQIHAAACRRQDHGATPRRVPLLSIV